MAPIIIHASREKQFRLKGFLDHSFRPDDAAFVAHLHIYPSRICRMVAEWPGFPQQYSLNGFRLSPIGVILRQGKRRSQQKPQNKVCGFHFVPFSRYNIDTNLLYAV
jgi:hypothetical protein